MIIDAHVHLGKSYAWASYESFVFDMLLSPQEEFSVEVFLEITKKFGIDMVAIMTTKTSIE